MFGSKNQGDLDKSKPWRTKLFFHEKINLTNYHYFA